MCSCWMSGDTLLCSEASPAVSTRRTAKETGNSLGFPANDELGAPEEAQSFMGAGLEVLDWEEQV